jgi:ABC-type antimicrobial peptide transport system permease subunit
MDFIRTADLGFNKESVLMLQLNTDSATHSRLKAFKNELMARSDVKQVSFAFDAPSSGNTWSSNFAFDKMEDRGFEVNLKFGDENYATTYGLELVAGRFYGASDTCREYVVNETFVKKTGFKDPQDAIGKLFRLGGRRPMPVVGVVKDFKQQSLREAVAPIAISPKIKYYQSAGIKLSGKNLLASNKEIQVIWDKYFPEYVYNASFLDENINRYYKQEQRLSLLYKVYAGLAIFISCLGLYGLVSFLVVQKTKEVGIRKVLGASVSGIIQLLAKDFVKLVLVAAIIAIPIAWWGISKWLEDFAYRVHASWWVFAMAGVGAIAIALITISFQAVRAAIMNPVKNLRTE